MNYRFVIYKRIKKSRPLFSPYNFYLLFNDIGLARFIDHCKDLVASIVKEGSTVPVTNSILMMRKALALPMSKFDKTDVKELAALTGLLEVLERSE